MPAAPAPTGRLISHPGFRRLLSLRLAGQWADGIFQASLAGAVLFNPERAATPGDIAAGFAVLLLPYSLLGPFAGVLLDRWSRQRVLVWANVLRAALVSVVALLVAGGVSGPALYAAALAVISVSRFVLSALSTGLPHVAPADRLITANALTTTAGSITAVLGGAVGVGLSAQLGTGNAGYAEITLGSAVGYLLAAGLASAFDRERLGPDAADQLARPSAAHVLAGLVAGARHLRADRPAAAAMAVIGAHRFVFGLATVATLLLYRYYFTGSGPFPGGLPGLTQVLVSGAAGALLAAVLTPRAVRRLGSTRWIVALLSGAAVGQLVLGVPFRTWTTVLAAALLGFAGQGVKVCVDTLLQQRIGDAFRGRVFGVYDTLFNVAFVTAAVVAAFTLPITGRSYPMLAVVVAGYAVAAAAYAWAAGQPERSASPPLRRSG